MAPLALFYLVLTLWGFRGALIAALAWSFLALARRLHRGERISMLLMLGTLLLLLRTTVSFITGSAFIYFAQPLAGTIVIAFVLFGSALIRRPFTQRFAGDFCPIDPEILARPLVHRFFVRISVLWATVLLLNALFVLWLLVTSSLHAFVLERAGRDVFHDGTGHLSLDQAVRGDDAERRDHRAVGGQGGNGAPHG